MISRILNVFGINAGPDVIVGARYALDGERNPFTEGPVQVRVTGRKEGWVSYKFIDQEKKNCGWDQYRKEASFKAIYRLIEEE